MKYFIPIVILVFSVQSFAEDKARNGPHNKIGHTKKSQEEKENSFIQRLINDDVDFMGSSSNDKPRYSDTGETLSQIEKLADLKDRGIITDEEFNIKKSVLLDKIQ
jgi:hypothetical protein|uniref:SHOCT domain-containing protein n=1 Tax=uncultured bacterium BAC13K9BAC TaxID=332979 RepID=Q4JMX6_9BACT|nr:unknown [uncultured bacterium BAC13K9BAC]